MTINYLSPGFVKLYYARTGVVKPHVKTIPVKPLVIGSVGDEPTFERNDGDDVLMSTAIDALIVLAKAIYAADISFTHAEFWSQPTPDDDPIFHFDYAIGVAGTNVGTTVIASQAVFSIRTALGGILRDTYMETVVPDDAVTFPPYIGVFGALNTYVISDAGWFRGRDGGVPIGNVSFKSKENDALRRKYITG